MPNRIVSTVIAIAAAHLAFSRSALGSGFSEKLARHDALLKTACRQARSGAVDAALELLSEETILHGMGFVLNVGRTILSETELSAITVRRISRALLDGTASNAGVVSVDAPALVRLAANGELVPLSTFRASHARLVAEIEWEFFLTLLEERIHVQQFSLKTGGKFFTTAVEELAEERERKARGAGPPFVSETMKTAALWARHPEKTWSNAAEADVWAFFLEQLGGTPTFSAERLAAQFEQWKDLPRSYADRARVTACFLENPIGPSPAHLDERVRADLQSAVPCSALFP